MYEKRVSKTSEQIRTEAAEAAKADRSALWSTPCECDECQKLLVQLYQWNYKRIEEEATQWYSMGMPVAAPVPWPSYPVFTTHPTAVVGQPHVCEPIGEGTSAIPSCRVCGRMLPATKPIITVGP